MTRVSLQQHIPLMKAYLCQDCNAVGNSAMSCPACASSVLLGLAGVLNREDQISNAKTEKHWMEAVAA